MGILQTFADLLRQKSLSVKYLRLETALDTIGEARIEREKFF